MSFNLVRAKKMKKTLMTGREYEGRAKDLATLRKKKRVIMTTKMMTMMMTEE